MDTNVENENLLVLRVQNNYGILHVYPVCQKSRAFAHIANKKTLSPNDLKDMAFIGFRMGFNNVPTEQIEKYNQNGFVGFQKFLDNWNG